MSFAAGSALDTLTGYPQPAEALRAHVTELKADPKAFAYRAVRVNLGLEPVESLYPADNYKKGVNTNKDRRKPGPTP